MKEGGGGSEVKEGDGGSAVNEGREGRKEVAEVSEVNGGRR